MQKKKLASALNKGWDSVKTTNQNLFIDLFIYLMVYFILFYLFILFIYLFI